LTTKSCVFVVSRRVAYGLALPAPAGKTRDVLQVLLEAFWPSRRIVQFDELCLPAAQLDRITRSS
jgi:hypothetical protein